MVVFVTLMLLAATPLGGGGHNPVGGSTIACHFLSAPIAESVISTTESLTPINASQIVPSCTYMSSKREVNLVMMNEATGPANAMMAAGWCAKHPSPGCSAWAKRFAKSKDPQEMYAIIRKAFGSTATSVNGLPYPAMLGPDEKVYVGTKGAVMIFQVRERTAPYSNSWISLPDLAIKAARLVVHP